MEPRRVAGGKKPETVLQDKIIYKLKGLDWFVKATHGSALTDGWPDLFCCHSKYGARWIEVKVKERYSFTSAQLQWFPKFCAHGSGIWVLTSDSDEEYNKLFKPPNWHYFLKNVFDPAFRT